MDLRTQFQRANRKIEICMHLECSGSDNFWKGRKQNYIQEKLGCGSGISLKATRHTVRDLKSDRPSELFCVGGSEEAFISFPQHPVEILSFNLTQSWHQIQDQLELQLSLNTFGFLVMIKPQILISPFFIFRFQEMIASLFATQEAFWPSDSAFNCCFTTLTL